MIANLERLFLERVLFQREATVSALWMWHTMVGYICAYYSAKKIEADPALASE